MATHVMPPSKPKPVPARKETDWTKPQALAIPKEGYFEYEQGNYGPVYPRTPACHGFTIIAKLKPGREEAMRSYAATVQEALQGDPHFLAPLKLHYLKWVLFDIGAEKYFMYQGIFDTDFDKYTDDAVALFTKSGLHTAFENLEGFPEDWKTNIPAFIKFVRDHHPPVSWNMGNIRMSLPMKSRRLSR
jgi:hypothetical protein